MKQCSKCGKTKEFSEFYRAKNTRNGFRSSCKKCISEYAIIYNKNNRKKLNERQRNWRAKNKHYCAEWQKKWWSKQTPEYKKAYRKRNYNIEKARKYIKGKLLENPNYYKENNEWRKKFPEKVREIARKYREKNLERLRKRDKEWRKKRLKENPRLRIDTNFSSAIRQSLKGKRFDKKWETLVGYTLQNLIQHLEKQFDDKMSWENYGSYWHIDHIVPISWFPYQTPEEQAFKDCWGLANLQPLEVFKNKSKGNRFIS